MAVLSVPKLGTELLKNLEPVLDSPRTVWVVCVIIYAINYGLDVVSVCLCLYRLKLLKINIITRALNSSCIYVKI